MTPNYILIYAIYFILCMLIIPTMVLVGIAGQNQRIERFLFRFICYGLLVAIILFIIYLL